MRCGRLEAGRSCVGTYNGKKLVGDKDVERVSVMGRQDQHAQWNVWVRNNQPIRARYLGHVSGNQPITDQYVRVNACGNDPG